MPDSPPPLPPDRPAGRQASASDTPVGRQRTPDAPAGRLESGPADRNKLLRSPRGRYAIWLAVLLWAALMAPLTRWGLPSRQSDDLLFGGDQPWSADQYRAAAALQARRQRGGGADTDVNPLAQRDQIVDLTATPAGRGEILRRYRLFSRQPDEMITFMALQRMHPRQLDFDPRLYQYGGGYIYLIGAALGASSALGLTHVTSDPALYLEHPEEFARFYIVARLVTLAFGALLLVAVWKLAHRAAGPIAAWLAALLLACTPVFISGVLEAKPHLPSACMILWATLAALDYRATGQRRHVVRMGLFAGYAFGLVLTGIVAAALWPALFITRRRALAQDAQPLAHYPDTRRQLLRRLLLAGAIAAAVFVVTNPYIPYNYLFNRAALASNVGNSTAMYAGQIRQAAAGAARVGKLLVESAGPGLLLAAVVGLAWLARRRPKYVTVTASTAAAMLLLSILLAANKPAEYGRFLILPVSIFATASAATLAAIAGGRRSGSAGPTRPTEQSSAGSSWPTKYPARWRRPLAAVATVAILVTMKTPIYVHSFVQDAGGCNESRHQAGLLLADLAAPGQAIAVLQEPAPYAVPPLDFAHRQILWLPPQPPPDLAPQSLPPWLVFTADDATIHASAWWHQYYRLAVELPAQTDAYARWAGYSRITWADKAVFIYERSSSPPD